MDRDQLPLQMGGELGQLEAEAVQHTQQLIAIGLALSGLLQVEEPFIPTRDLDTLEAQAGGPSGYVFQVVEGFLISGKLGQEDCRPLHSFHKLTHPARVRLLVTARSTKVMLRSPS
jgi:hypothetical protein